VVAILEAGHPLPFVVASVQVDLPELQASGAGGAPRREGAQPAERRRPRRGARCLLAGRPA
jgi:hypothetical protein